MSGQKWTTQRDLSWRDISGWRHDHAWDSPFMSALELAQRIRRGEISAVAVTAQILDRIEATQWTLNAFITVDADRAMQRAEVAALAVARGQELPPLHGVPVSVKDVLNTVGFRITWGSVLMADNVPDTDAVTASATGDL